MDNIVTFWRRLIWRMRYLIDGRLRPDPGTTQEFLLIVNFAETRAADHCSNALSHLNMKSEVVPLPNGRANANFIVFAKPESKRFKSARDAVSEAAERHGGSLVSCFVLMGGSSESANAE